MAKTPIIEVKNASVIKDESVLLKKISLAIGEGERIALIGPNGAGKSSLIKLITGEYRPIHKPDATVKLFGKERYDLFELRNRFGIITGDLQETFRKDLTGEETVLSGYFGSVGTYGYQEITPEMKKKAKTILKEAGIQHLSKKYISHMSPGEARRVLIARALIHNPKMLILDEPTNSLDPKAAHEFLNTVRLVAKKGRSMVMVTHHINEIIPEIERIIMIKDGEIFFDGTKQKTLTTRNVSLLFDTKLRIHKSNGYYTISYG